MDSMSRESKKNQLRRRVISGDSAAGRRWEPEEDSEESQKSHKKKHRHRWILWTLLAMIAAFAAGGVYWYERYFQFEAQTIGWERILDRGEGSYTGYKKFASGILKYTKDGASSIGKDGKDIWVQSYEMKSPIAVVNGEYAAIADQQGNSIYICDQTGCIGVANTVLPIVKITISKKGVVAAILEDQNSSYIYFYRKDGTEMQISMKGVLGGEIGYPLDISLSPDGTMLMGSYMFIEDGALRSRVAFYNFSEVGKNALNRFVGGFHDIYKDSIVPRVQYVDSVYSVAFAQDSISFFSSRDVMSPALVKQVMVEDEIQSVFYGEQYVGVIVLQKDSEYRQRMDVYKPNGDQVFSREFTYDYSCVDIDGDTIFLYNEDSCRVYNRFGNLKYEGPLDFSVSKMIKGSLPDQIIAAGAQAIKEIKLH